MPVVFVKFQRLIGPRLPCFYNRSFTYERRSVIAKANKDRRMGGVALHHLSNISLISLDTRLTSGIVLIELRP